LSYTWGSLGSGRIGTNGRVYTIAIDDSGNIYVGGSFTIVSDIPANNIAKWNTTTSTWSNLTSGISNGVNNIVSSIAISGSDIYVGGYFTLLGDGITNANYITKFNTITSTWATLTSGITNGVNSPIYSVAVSGSDVYVGGGFTKLGDGTSANYIAKWNSTSNTWSTLTSGTSNGVNDGVAAISISGNEVYIGGGFSLLGDKTTSANHIAKWNTATSSWSTLKSGASNGVNGNVTALAISDSDVYVGGGFNLLGDGTTSASNIAIWHNTTSTWSTLNSGAFNGVKGWVSAITINGSDVYVGGDFTQLGDGTSADYIAKWNNTSNSWLTLTGGSFNGLNSWVWAIAIIGSNVFAGGEFTQLGDGKTFVNYIVKWNGNWSAFGSSNNGVNNSVLSIAISGSDIYVGGSFNLLGDGTSANYIAKWNTTTGAWSTLKCGDSNGVNYYVRSIVISGSDVYVGGDFNQLGDGTSANCIAKWNTISNTWSTLKSGKSNGVNWWVEALAVSGSDVYVGGWFTLLGDSSTSANCIAKWNTTSNTWSTLKSGSSNGVSASQPYIKTIAISGSDVYVGGNFTKLGDGTSAKHIAKWNTNTGTWSTLASGTSNGINGISAQVSVIAVNGSDVYVGGGFSLLGDGTTIAYGLAKWNATTNTWSTLSSGLSLYSQVYSIAINGSDVYVGGYISQLGDGTPAKHLVKWNSNTSTWTVIGNGVNSYLEAMQINPADGKMYIGGGFTILNGTTVAYYVGTFTDPDNPLSVKSSPLTTVSDYTLSQNYPNPFNPTTTINYSLPHSGNVKLIVYNSIGSKVATLVNEYKPAGSYSVQFNAANLASGIYLYRLESGSYNAAKKLILIK
jgi:hypothetical protein